jgi:hypothetical protein
MRISAGHRMDDEKSGSCRNPIAPYLLLTRDVLWYLL